MKHLIMLITLTILVSCAGPKGDKGDTGPQGIAGDQGVKGNAGKTAYQTWLDLGNTGSEQDFIDSLTGPRGTDAPDNSGHLLLIDYLERSSNIDILVKYAGTSDTRAGGLNEDIDQNLFIFKDTRNDKIYVIDSSNFDPSSITWGNLTIYIQNNREEIFSDWSTTNGNLDSIQYQFYKNAAGTAWYFEENSSTSKDLELMGAKAEVMEASHIEDMLVSYGLSTERSKKLGRLMTSYNKIKNKRGLTNKEKDVLTKELTGLSFDKATSVLAQEGYDVLVQKASEVNGADPEAIKEILNQVL